jgi:ankyrin repeat protein
MKSRSIVPFVFSLLAIFPSTEVLAQKSGSIDLYLAENTAEVQQAPSWQEIVDKAPSLFEDKQAWIDYFNTEIPRYLELGGDPNAKDYLNRNVLHYAAASGNQELVEFLIAQGADLNAKGINGHTVLHAAATSGNRKIVELLIVRGADLNAKDNDGNTVLHIATISGNREIVEFLIAKDTDLNAKNSEGKTPLDIALEFDLPEIVEILKQKGAVLGQDL